MNVEQEFPNKANEVSKEMNEGFKSSQVDKVFTLVKDEQNKVRVTVGGKVISAKQFNDWKQADNYIRTRPYEIIFNSMFVIADFIKGGQLNENETRGEQGTTSSDNN